MKTKDLRELDVAELAQKEKELSQELFTLRFRLSTKQLENPARLPNTKRELARVKTIIAEKRREAGRA